MPGSEKKVSCSPSSSPSFQFRQCERFGTSDPRDRSSCSNARLGAYRPVDIREQGRTTDPIDERTRRASTSAQRRALPAEHSFLILREYTLLFAFQSISGLIAPMFDSENIDRMPEIDNVMWSRRYRPLIALIVRLHRYRSVYRRLKVSRTFVSVSVRRVRTSTCSITGLDTGLRGDSSLFTFE